MELFETNKHYFILNGSIVLFCDRLSGQIFFGESIDLVREWNPVCLGQIKGVIGKIKFFPDGESKLIVINKTKSIGRLPVYDHIHRITRTNIIPLNARSISNLDLESCKRHSLPLKKSEKSTAASVNIPSPFLKTFQEYVISAAEGAKPKPKDVRDREKFEKRMLQEVHKMFHDSEEATDSFYACCDTWTSVDITSTIQRQKGPKYAMSSPLWRRVNDKFFWNKAMLQEAIESAERLLIEKFGRCIFQTQNEPPVIARTMIRDMEQLLTPIIQGFVQVEPFNLHISAHSPLNTSKNVPNLPQTTSACTYPLTIGLISRRSRQRAGTRFRRRGVDCNGNTANYVETEQILLVEHDHSPHVLSFVQVRGSVPIYWSQFSPKYRPPIILEKSDDENLAALKLHFSSEFQSYDKIVVVNLVDTGTEKSERKLSDEYLRHIIKLNSSMVTCVLFDFHDYCRGLQFDNVSILMRGVTEIFRNMKYTWVDKNGMICEQKSVFRVNCVDCLDRTNVVQCMFAGVQIETQLRKLGLLTPEHSLHADFYQVMQVMWANNGDAISRQYSGTAAMKGDFTRTRRRTASGLVKDGVSSVYRYYLRLREITRQAALDLVTGNNDSAEISSLRKGHSDLELKLLRQKVENIKELTLRCKKACLKSNEECMAESILIYCTEGEKKYDDMNTVALVTSKTLYFVCNLVPLPSTRPQVPQKREPYTISLPLQRICRIQLGYEPTLFRPSQPMMRIFYDPPKLAIERMHISQFGIKSLGDFSGKVCHRDGTFLTFKQPGLRLFNNLLLEVKRDLDVVESLKAVAQSFYLASKSLNPDVQFEETIVKFDTIKSEAVPKEWIYHINTNFIYNKIVPSTGLKYDIMYLGEFGSTKSCYVEPIGDINVRFSYDQDKTLKSCQVGGSDCSTNMILRTGGAKERQTIESDNGCCEDLKIEQNTLGDDNYMVGEMVLDSCGIVSSSVPRLILDEQLAAVISDVYQRRAEQVSLRLCIDNSQEEECLEITSDSVENNISMPPIDVCSDKVAKRLTNKQIDMAFFVENLRRKVLPSDDPLLTQMIIF